MPCSTDMHINFNGRQNAKKNRELKGADTHCTYEPRTEKFSAILKLSVREINISVTQVTCKGTNSDTNICSDFICGE